MAIALDRFRALSFCVGTILPWLVCGVPQASAAEPSLRRNAVVAAVEKAGPGVVNIRCQIN